MGKNPQTALCNALSVLKDGPHLRSDVTNSMKNFSPAVRAKVWEFMEFFGLIEIHLPAKRKGKGGRGTLVRITNFGAGVFSGIVTRHAGV